MDTNNNKVVVVEKNDGYKMDPWVLQNQGAIIGAVKDAEANIRYGIKDAEAQVRFAVKDSEADIRHDVLFEGQENQKTSLEVEARLKDRLTIDRNASDAQFMNLGNKICDVEKEALKQGYEARLEAIKEAEKTRNSVAHALEEIREDLCECCKDQAVTAAVQTGLLNLIVSSLNVK